jgi:hypothetical protein
MTTLQKLTCMSLFMLCLHSAGASAVLTATAASNVNYDFSGRTIPKWSGGDLLALDYQSTASPVIRVFGRDGREILAVSLTVPQATTIVVAGFGRGSSGLIVACGRAIDGQGRQNAFLALLTPESGSQRLIALNDYYAERVAAAPDGTVWTFWHGVGDQFTTPDTLRHFDSNGKMIGSVLPGSTFSSRPALVDPHNELAVSANRVALFAASDSRYIELSLDGSIETDVRITPLAKGEKVTGFALTDTDHVFITSQVSARPRHHNLYSLDAQSGQLTMVAMPNNMTWVLGGDGNNVVGRTGSASFTLFSIQ